MRRVESSSEPVPRSSPRIGFTLQPEERFLDLLADVIRELPDYYEVAPETLWMADAHGRVGPNGFHRRFEALRRECGKPFVAHGVGLSPGGLARGDEPRYALWLERIARTHEAFEFEWYTDHLGTTTLDGTTQVLPLPLPMTSEVALHLRARLERLREVVGDCGLENTANYYVLGDPLQEPGFLAEALDAPGLHLLLDLHNLYTMSVNFEFDARAYLERLPLERVIEIHVSGGSTSEPAWLPDRSTLRLDSHDSAVPKPVWTLLEEVLPSCAGLRGVTLERMEGTVEESDVPILRRELERLRELCA